jgi:hypothetical protein
MPPLQIIMSSSSSLSPLRNRRHRTSKLRRSSLQPASAGCFNGRPRRSDSAADHDDGGDQDNNNEGKLQLHNDSIHVTTNRLSQSARSVPSRVATTTTPNEAQPSTPNGDDGVDCNSISSHDSMSSSRWSSDSSSHHRRSPSSTRHHHRHHRHRQHPNDSRNDTLIWRRHSYDNNHSPRSNQAPIKPKRRNSETTTTETSSESILDALFLYNFNDSENLDYNRDDDDDDDDADEEEEKQEDHRGSGGGDSRAECFLSIPPSKNNKNETDEFCDNGGVSDDDDDDDDDDDVSSFYSESESTDGAGDDDFHPEPHGDNVENTLTGTVPVVSILKCSTSEFAINTTTPDDDVPSATPSQRLVRFADEDGFPIQRLSSFSKH